MAADPRDQRLVWASAGNPMSQAGRLLVTNGGLTGAAKASLLGVMPLSIVSVLVSDEGAKSVLP